MPARIRIMRDRLVELRDALAQPILGPLVPEEPALEEGVIGVRVLRVASGKARSLFLRQREGQRARHLIGDGILDREQVRQLFVEVAGPPHRAVVAADDVHADANPVSRALNRSVHNNVDGKFTGSDQRIGPVPVVHSAPRWWDERSHRARFPAS